MQCFKSCEVQPVCRSNYGEGAMFATVNTELMMSWMMMMNAGHISFTATDIPKLSHFTYSQTENGSQEICEGTDGWMDTGKCIFHDSASERSVVVDIQYISSESRALIGTGTFGTTNLCVLVR